MQIPTVRINSASSAMPKPISAMQEKHTTVNPYFRGRLLQQSRLGFMAICSLLLVSACEAATGKRNQTAGFETLQSVETLSSSKDDLSDVKKAYLAAERKTLPILLDVLSTNYAGMTKIHESLRMEGSTEAVRAADKLAGFLEEIESASKEVKRQGVTQEFVQDPESVPTEAQVQAFHKYLFSEIKAGIFLITDLDPSLKKQLPPEFQSMEKWFDSQKKLKTALLKLQDAHKQTGWFKKYSGHWSFPSMKSRVIKYYLLPRKG